MSASPHTRVPSKLRPPLSEDDRFYRFAQRTATSIWRLIAGLEVVGLDNIPRQGPFLLVANHESNLDPMLIQGSCPRVVAGMAKSTQFTAPVVGYLVRKLNGFPARRYQVDPQAVRTALRYLAAGTPVAIYLEGERSWDGRPQQPRRGTIHLVLRAGVPVVPCVISGAFAAWPRWSSFPHRNPIRIAFGPQIEFSAVRDRVRRRTLIDSTSERLQSAIAALR